MSIQLMYKSKPWRRRSRRERAAIRKRAEITKAEVAKLKSDPCTDCGNSFSPESMDYDHVPGRGEKRSNVSLIRVLSVALSEIKKCDLVCANCHRVRTKNRLMSNRQKEREKRRRVDELCTSFMKENERVV